MAAAFSSSSSSSSSSSFILFVIITTLLVFTSISSSPAASVTTKLPQIEVDALKEIGDKLEKAWNFSVDPCSGNAGWATEGLDSAFANNLTCDCSYSNGTVCHVVSILLKSQNLTGVLPEELAKLTHLHTFDIARNYINGTIPPEWASLPLVNLSIMANRVTGKIPKELGNISTLERLVLENNQLEGTLPEELGNLGNLTRLIIGSNKLTGELPTSFGRLTNLTILWLDDNNFTGKIPDFIANWKQLQLLMILGTLMEGPIPSNISLLEQLTELRIADLKGPVSRFPPLENLKNLNTLVLRNCSLAGEIPSYIGGMTNLKMLDLSFNNLTGEIPQSFGRLSHLVFMFLKSNQLTGFLPSWILSSMGNMDLSINNFSYVNHQETCPQGNLNLVGFSSTNDNITASCRRRGFPCRGIPKYYSLFINCGGAQTIVNGNKYEADLEQRGASMFFNGVRGNWAVTSTGKFMGEGNDKNSYIARSTSSLFIADQSLYSTARRSAISLTYYGVCLQNGNYSVKLHFAEIEFTNDTTWCSLGKRSFDVYIQHYLVLKDFNIEDEAHGVGRELIRSFNAVVSTNTLQIDLYWAGKGTTAIPSRGFYGPLVSAISVTPNFKPIDYDQQSTRVLTWQIILIIGTCCLIIVLISVILHQKIRGKEAIDKELRGLEKQTSLFSLKQIKSATGDFDPSKKIGEGGFGPVYKGTLPDGSEIAVKQLSSRSRQGNREFLAEIGMISAVQHPNVVKLLGCCIEGNQLMLVYEFMVNNSLARALFVADEERIKLDWTTRFKIGMGIARGLAYLHEESAMKVVHRDIKATNILLDKDLNAKISDFGLAKLDEGDTTHISTRIAGTIGYMAPEYATRGYLTDKADVYSFGVVILELVSGKNNANWVPSNDYAFLLDWAYVLLEKGNLLDLVDPSLNSNFSKEEALRMLNVALLCTSPSPTLRPSMKTVMKMIEGRAEIQPASSRTRTSLFHTYGYESRREISHDTERYSHQISRPRIDSSESVSVVSDATNSGVVTRSSN